MFGLPHFDFIHKVVGADRIIWSVDYPFLTLDGTREFLEGLPVSEDDKEKIAHRNAETCSASPFRNGLATGEGRHRSLRQSGGDEAASDRAAVQRALWPSRRRSGLSMPAWQASTPDPPRRPLPARYVCTDTCKQSLYMHDNLQYCS
jgi:hypothetical protein